jgi:hypothetical protein
MNSVYLLKLINQLFLVNWLHGWWIQQVFMYTCDDILSGGSHGQRPSCEPAGVSSPDPVPSFLCLSMPSGPVLLFFFPFSLFLRWEKKPSPFCYRRPIPTPHGDHPRARAMPLPCMSEMTRMQLKTSARRVSKIDRNGLAWPAHKELYVLTYVRTCRMDYILYAMHAHMISRTLGHHTCESDVIDTHCLLKYTFISSLLIILIWLTNYLINTQSKEKL